MKLIKWFAGIFEDQTGEPSAKRFVLFICLFFYWLLVKGSLEGKPINENILFTTGGIILFCIGAVTSEFFKKDNSTTSNTKTTTTEIEKKETPTL